MRKPVSEQPRVIEKKVLIEASAEVVFNALTQAKELSEWFSDGAHSDPRVGGEMTVYWKSGKSRQEGRAVYTRLEPQVRVELLWVDEGRAPSGDPRPPGHRISYRISAKRSRCEVAMRDEDPVALDDETFEILNEGWNGVLLELKDHCERKERGLRSRLLRSVESSPS